MLTCKGIYWKYRINDIFCGQLKVQSHDVLCWNDLSWWKEWNMKIMTMLGYHFFARKDNNILFVLYFLYLLLSTFTFYPVHPILAYLSPFNPAIPLPLTHITHSISSFTLLSPFTTIYPHLSPSIPLYLSLPLFTPVFAFQLVKLCLEVFTWRNFYLSRPLTPENEETEESSNPPPDDVETRLVRGYWEIYRGVSKESIETGNWQALHKGQVTTAFDKITVSFLDFWIFEMLTFPAVTYL